MELKSFIKLVPNFDQLSLSEKVDIFVYYLTKDEGQSGIKGKQISECFEQLRLTPYSNIPAYLNKHSSRGKGQKFVKQKDFFYIEKSTKKLLDEVINCEGELLVSNNLFPLSIFDNTRGYLVGLAKEAACCYDTKLYNSCFFMIRKIIEVLIIDIYEKHKIDDRIKNRNENYLMLSDLLNKLSSEKEWTLSKLAKQEIPKIKKMADSSVHNKLFSAKKPDLDNIKTDLRIILQELIQMVDYPNWK